MQKYCTLFFFYTFFVESVKYFCGQHIMRPIQHIQRFESEDDLIQYTAEVSNLMVGEKERLKPIEFKCFCVLVKAHNKFGDITSKSARDWAILEMSLIKGSFTPNSLVRYRSRLLQKGWLQKSESGYAVAPVFDFKKLPLNRERIFLFAAVYKAKEV